MAGFHQIGAPAPGASETVLVLDGVRKLFGAAPAVDGASLEVKRGEVFTLLGPSGCGKTTTLRLVAGLEHPDAGEITLRGRLGDAVVEAGRDRRPGCVRVGLNGPLAGNSIEGRAAPGVTLIAGGEAHVAIRPEDIDVGSDDRAGLENALTGVIDTLLFVGDRYEARVALGGEQSILLLLPRVRDWREGQRLRLGFPPEAVTVWPT